MPKTHIPGYQNHERFELKQAPNTLIQRELVGVILYLRSFGGQIHQPGCSVVANEDTDMNPAIQITLNRSQKPGGLPSIFDMQPTQLSSNQLYDAFKQKSKIAHNILFSRA